MGCASEEKTKPNVRTRGLRKPIRNKWGLRRSCVIMHLVHRFTAPCLTRVQGGVRHAWRPYEGRGECVLEGGSTEGGGRDKQNER